MMHSIAFTPESNPSQAKSIAGGSLSPIILLIFDLFMLSFCSRVLFSCLNRGNPLVTFLVQSHTPTLFCIIHVQLFLTFFRY